MCSDCRQQSSNTVASRHLKGCRCENMDRRSWAAGGVDDFGISALTVVRAAQILLCTVFLYVPVCAWISSFNLNTEHLLINSWKCSRHSKLNDDTNNDLQTRSTMQISARTHLHAFVSVCVCVHSQFDKIYSHTHTHVCKYFRVTIEFMAEIALWLYLQIRHN